jgi:hypothetical protein
MSLCVALCCGAQVAMGLRARSTARVAAWGVGWCGASVPVVASTYHAGLRDVFDVGSSHGEGV